MRQCFYRYYDCAYDLPFNIVNTAQQHLYDQLDLRPLIAPHLR